MYWFNLKTWAVSTEDNGGVKVPFPVLFLIMPVVGLMFLMFLPLIGFILVGKALWLATAGRLFRSTVLAPPAMTGAAALTGNEAGGPAEPLKELENEVSRRRV
jgi:hypothetical protein